LFAIVAISAHIATNIVQEIWDIYAICRQANASCSESPQKRLPSFVDTCNVTQNEIYWLSISQRLLAALLEQFDAFCRNFTIKRDTRASFAEVFI
jgi:hypothetical protein